MCAKAALMNKTWADDRVFDSNNTPLADMLTTDAAPYISIFTDEDSIPEILGRDFYLEPHSLSLTLEIGCAKSVEISGSSPSIVIPETDEGLEFAVDVVQTQMLAALFGVPNNQWAELLRKIMFRMTRMPSIRGGSAQAGTRFAARQVVLVSDTLADTPPGVVPQSGHPVRDFIDMALVDPDMAVAGRLLENVIEQTAAPSWRQAQAWLGLTKEGIQAIGLAPIVEEDETAAVLEQVTLTNLVPMPPVVSCSSPLVNPPEFHIAFVTSFADERDAHVGDVIALYVGSEVYRSDPLTAELINSGSISMVGGILPDGLYAARAQIERKPAATTLPASLSDWSETVTFVIAN
jgi:hypothetical protein